MGLPPNVTVVNKNSIFQQREYFFDQPVATGYYRTGITTALTVDANAQADDRVAMSGAGFATQTVSGLFTGEFSTSATYSGGAGFAVRLGYGYDRFDWFGPYKSTFRLLGEYRSQDYATVGNFSSPASLQYVHRGELFAELPYDVTAGLSFSVYLSG